MTSHIKADVKMVKAAIAAMMDVASFEDTDLTKETMERILLSHFHSEVFLALNSMNFREFRYFIKHWVDGETYSSIAKKEGLAPSSVSSVAKRGIQKVMDTGLVRWLFNHGTLEALYQSFCNVKACDDVQ